MDTPICDFVRRYAESNALRLHMPGHKGASFLGMERFDITEIDGADSLYEADGIIRQSETNAGRLFGCSTFYATEGSSQCIRTMLYLAVQRGKAQGRKPLIAAARNVHKSFLSACALLDLDVMWLYPEETTSYLSCEIRPETLDALLQNAEQKPTAVYLTSPDYLGKVADIEEIAAVCRRHDALLLVDNAHGAYLRFLEKSLHPIDLGADLCCDSAHKTLPVLTGGAYLHISPAVEADLSDRAKNALSLFGSTSPSYLILQSLDAANDYLDQYGAKLQAFLPAVATLKENLTRAGYCLYGQEPLKITIAAKSYGYTGKEIAQYLLSHNIVCEFADQDYLVLMVTPEISAEDIRRLQDILLALPQKSPLQQGAPAFRAGTKALSIREAMLSSTVSLPVSESKGRILAAASVGCPPAVPILVCGERIDRHAIACFQYYGVNAVTVVNKEDDLQQ